MEEPTRPVPAEDGGEFRNVAVEVEVEYAEEEEEEPPRSATAKQEEANAALGAEGSRPFIARGLLGEIKEDAEAADGSGGAASAFGVGNRTVSADADGSSSSQESMQHVSSHHDVAMDLINSVTGVDDEGRSRQRILSFAGKRYLNAIERNPDDPDAYYNWALVLQESADNVDPKSGSSKDPLLEEACKKYAEATRLCPTLYDAYYNWAIAIADRAKMQGRTKEAEHLWKQAILNYEKAVQLNWNSPQIYIDTHVSKSREETARIAVRKAKGQSRRSESEDRSRGTSGGGGSRRRRRRRGKPRRGAVERSGGHPRPMWAWGLAERAVAGLLGSAGAHGGRWNTAVAVGVTAAAGIALVAIVVSSRRGGIKSPWRRGRRKPVLASKEWRSLFTPEGKLYDGGVKLVKRVRNGGIEPSIRAEVWPFLLGVYSLDSSQAEREAVKDQNRRGYLLLRKHCLRKNNEESKRPNETTGVNNEESKRPKEAAGVNNGESISPIEVKEYVTSVGSEEQPEKESVEEHVTSEEANSSAILEKEIEDKTDKAIPENQVDENLCSSSSHDEDESEKSDVTHVEASCNDVVSVHQSSVEDEEESMPRYSNTGGSMETEAELSKAARPVKSARTVEDFETWQRIIRLDAVRANNEWVSYSPSQATVTREKAIESAQAVCLKDYEHLEAHRIHHASRLVAILEAYATYDPEIGYCQGMSDLLAPLLAVLEEDDEAFWCFAGFMRKARHNFRLDEVGIRRQLNMVSKIIKNKDFRLYRHLEMLEAADCFFVYRMVVVMFRRELTFEQTLSLWEVMWADQAASRAGIARSSWGKLRLGAPPTDDLLLYAIAASVLEKRKLIIESYSSMDEIIRDCNNMAGQLDIWKLLDDAHNLVVTLHDRIE